MTPPKARVQRESQPAGRRSASRPELVALVEVDAAVAERVRVAALAWGVSDRDVVERAVDALDAAREAAAAAR